MNNHTVSRPSVKNLRATQLDRAKSSSNPPALPRKGRHAIEPMDTLVKDAQSAIRAYRAARDRFIEDDSNENYDIYYDACEALKSALKAVDPVSRSHPYQGWLWFVIDSDNLSHDLRGVRHGDPIAVIGRLPWVARL